MCASQRCGSCTNNCSASPLGFEACCNGQCTDFDQPSNCGGCGNLCFNIGGNATCENRTCNIICNEDTPTTCTGPFNGSGLVLPNVTFCVNTNTSIFACGGCGNICPSDPNVRLNFEPVTNCRFNWTLLDLVVPNLDGRQGMFQGCSQVGFGKSGCTLHVSISFRVQWTP